MRWPTASGGAVAEGRKPGPLLHSRESPFQSIYEYATPEDRHISRHF